VVPRPRKAGRKFEGTDRSILQKLPCRLGGIRNEKLVPPLNGRCEKIGRARLPPSRRLASPGSMRLGGSLALPTPALFEFFHTFRGVGGCPVVNVALETRRRPPTPPLIGGSLRGESVACWVCK